MHKAILLEESDYSAGDTFKLKVGYKWWTNPSKDYTVTVYSSQKLDIKDKNGGTNMMHMDGQSPSAFTDSSYTGMAEFNTENSQDNNNDQNDHPDTPNDDDTTDGVVDYN